MHGREYIRYDDKAASRLAPKGGAAAWPLAARAQQGGRVRRIGVLMSGDANDPVVKARISAFIQALADLGWTDGRNVRIDLRWHGADADQTRALAQELVGLQPDIILANGTPATVAHQREMRTIPIVFVNASDPVASGLVERLNQPGGNVTGFATLELSLGGKWLELLSEIAPGLKRVGVMFNPDTALASLYRPSFEMAARTLKVEPIIAPVHSDAEIESAIIGGPKQRTGGLSEFSLCQRRRLALLRIRSGRHLSSRRDLCRSHPARREAGRSPGAVAGEIRDGRQPQDRQGARSCHTPIDPAARRQVIE
jgi:putative ABC transport system substrate-binding protein